MRREDWWGSSLDLVGALGFKFEGRKDGWLVESVGRW